jgi:hypothetical protein
MTEGDRLPAEPKGALATRLAEIALRAGLEAAAVFFVGWIAYAVRLWLGLNRLRPIGEPLRDGPAWAMALGAAIVWFLLRTVSGALSMRKPEVAAKQHPVEKPTRRRSPRHHRR